MNTPLIETVEQLTTDSARYVFQEMLDATVTPEAAAPLPTEPDGQVVSSVGFVGDANGIVHLYTGVRFARVIAARMLGRGDDVVDGDDLVNEAMSELANVVVGRIKSHLCDAGHSCAITVPSVLRGQQLTAGEISDTSYRLLGFRHGEHRVLIEVAVKEP